MTTCTTRNEREVLDVSIRRFVVVGHTKKRTNINYKRIFNETLDNVTAHLDSRFYDYNNLESLALHSSSRFEEYRQRFPENSFIHYVLLSGQVCHDTRHDPIDLYILTAGDSFTTESAVAYRCFLHTPKQQGKG